MIIVVLRWLRLLFSFCFFVLFVFCILNYRTSVYLMQQARGQISVLLKSSTLSEFGQQQNLTAGERDNLLLIEKVKAFSVDSLGFLQTKNFTTVYNQHNSPILWVITACDPFEFKAYHWRFPLVGKVTYKGFFKKKLAENEYHRLKSQGYDVDLRSVSAWSTLGWFNDPLLSSMLARSRGGLCNLLFHELFHATYYREGSVDLNENLANFIADKATRLFLANDPKSLAAYSQKNEDDKIYTNYMLAKKNFLGKYYQKIKNEPRRDEMKILALLRISDSIRWLPLHDKNKFISRKKEIMEFKNAYFIDFQQYDSMQDSLEKVFNKIYKANLKNLVRDLRSNKINC